MPVAFGFIAGTRVSTPDGAANIEALGVGDRVIAWDLSASKAVSRTVAAVWSEPVDQLVAVDGGEVALAGTTPGTAVWDAFEGTFRGAGSLSTAGELLVWDGPGAHVVPIEDLPERAADGAKVWHLTLDGDEGTFFADRVLVRHRESM
jgi:hypothetical protein